MVFLGHVSLAFDCRQSRRAPRSRQVAPGGAASEGRRGHALVREAYHPPSGGSVGGRGLARDEDRHERCDHHGDGEEQERRTQPPLVRDEAADLFVAEALFATITNANFDNDRIIDLIKKALSRREALKDKFLAAYKEKNGREFDEALHDHR